MLKKILCCYLICFLALFNVYASELAVKKRLNYIKSELIKLTNDETKTSQDYIGFLDREIQKVDAIEAPYDGDFTSDELTEIKDYLIKVKKIYEQQGYEEDSGILSTIWNWLVSASPYIAFSASMIGALFLGFSFFGDDDNSDDNEQSGKEDQVEESPEGQEIPSEEQGEEPPTPSVTPITPPEKKPYFGQTAKDLSQCVLGTGRIHSNVAWSPDKRFIAVGDFNGKIYICDVHLNKLVREIKVHESEVIAVAWDPSGKYIASGSADKTVKVWNVNTGELESYLGIFGFFMGQVGWSPHKKYFTMIGYDDRVYLWKVSPTNLKPTGLSTIRLTGNTKVSNLSFSWSLDGKYIAAGGMDSPVITIWEADKWAIDEREITTSFSTYSLEDHWVTSVVWAHDNHIVSTTSISDEIKIWKFSPKEEKVSKNPLFILSKGKKNYTKIYIDPSRKYIVSVHEFNPVLRIWDIKTGNLLSSIKEAANIDIDTPSWSPDGKFIIYGLEKKNSIKVRPILYK